MRYLVSLIFLLISIVGISQTTQFRMVGIPDTAWTVVDDSTYSAPITFSADQTGGNFNSLQIQTGWRLFTGTEQLYRISAIADSTLNEATLTVVEIAASSAPTNQVMVFNPQGKDAIPAFPFGSEGSTSQLQAAIISYNSRITASSTYVETQFDRVLPIVDTVSQTSHGLNQFDPVWYSGNYVLARDTGQSVQINGVIIEVIDVNTFVMQRSGRFTMPSHGYPLNSQLWLQPDGSYSVADTTNHKAYGYPVNSNTIEIGMRVTKIASTEEVRDRYNWTSNRTYVLNEIINYGGVEYRLKAANSTGERPDQNADKWAPTSIDNPTSGSGNEFEIPFFDNTTTNLDTDIGLKYQDDTLKSPRIRVESLPNINNGSKDISTFLDSISGFRSYANLGQVISDSSSLRIGNTVENRSTGFRYKVKTDSVLYYTIDNSRVLNLNNKYAVLDLSNKRVWESKTKFREEVHFANLEDGEEIEIGDAIYEFHYSPIFYDYVINSAAGAANFAADSIPDPDGIFVDTIRLDAVKNGVLFSENIMSNFLTPLGVQPHNIDIPVIHNVDPGPRGNWKADAIIFQDGAQEDYSVKMNQYDFSPGDTVTFSFWYKGNDGAGVDERMNSLGFTGTAGSTIGGTIPYSLILDGEWHQYIQSGTIGGSYSFFWRFQNFVANDTLYMADFQLSEGISVDEYRRTYYDTRGDKDIAYLYRTDIIKNRVIDLRNFFGTDRTKTVTNAAHIINAAIGYAAQGKRANRILLPTGFTFLCTEPIEMERGVGIYGGYNAYRTFNSFAPTENIHTILKFDIRDTTRSGVEFIKSAGQTAIDNCDFQDFFITTTDSAQLLNLVYSEELNSSHIKNITLAGDPSAYIKYAQWHFDVPPSSDSHYNTFEYIGFGSVAPNGFVYDGGSANTFTNIGSTADTAFLINGGRFNATEVSVEGANKGFVINSPTAIVDVVGLYSEAAATSGGPVILMKNGLAKFINARLQTATGDTLLKIEGGQYFEIDGGLELIYGTKFIEPGVNVVLKNVSTINPLYEELITPNPELKDWVTITGNNDSYTTYAEFKSNIPRNFQTGSVQNSSQFDVGTITNTTTLSGVRFDGKRENLARNSTDLFPATLEDANYRLTLDSIVGPNGVGFDGDTIADAITAKNALSFNLFNAGHNNISAFEPFDTGWYTVTLYAKKLNSASKFPRLVFQAPLLGVQEEMFLSHQDTLWHRYQITYYVEDIGLGGINIRAKNWQAGDVIALCHLQVNSGRFALPYEPTTTTGFRDTLVRTEIGGDSIWYLEGGTDQNEINDRVFVSKHPSALTRAISASKTFVVDDTLTVSGNLDLENLDVIFTKKGFISGADTITADGATIQANKSKKLWSESTVVSGNWNVDLCFLEWTIGSNRTSRTDNFRALTNCIEMDAEVRVQGYEYELATSGSSSYHTTNEPEIKIIGDDGAQFTLYTRHSSSSDGAYIVDTLDGFNIWIENIVFETDEYQAGTYTNSQRYKFLRSMYDAGNFTNVKPFADYVVFKDNTIHGDIQMLFFGTSGSIIDENELAGLGIRKLIVEGNKTDQTGNTIRVSQVPFGTVDIKDNRSTNIREVFVRLTTSGLTAEESAVRSSLNYIINVSNNKITGDEVVPNIASGSSLGYVLSEGGDLRVYDNIVDGIYVDDSGEEVWFVYGNSRTIDMRNNRIINVFNPSHWLAGDPGSLSALRFKACPNVQVHNNTFGLTREGLRTAGLLDSTYNVAAISKDSFWYSLYSSDNNQISDDTTGTSILEISGNTFLSPIVNAEGSFSHQNVKFTNNNIVVDYFYQTYAAEAENICALFDFTEGPSATYTYDNRNLIQSGNTVTIKYSDCGAVEVFSTDQDLLDAGKADTVFQSIANGNTYILDTSAYAYPIHFSSKVERSEKIISNGGSGITWSGPYNEAQNPVTQTNSEYYFKVNKYRDYDTGVWAHLNNGKLQLEYEQSTDTVLTVEGIPLNWRGRGQSDTIPPVIDIRLTTYDSIGLPLENHYRVAFAFSEASQSTAFNGFMYWNGSSVVYQAVSSDNSYQITALYEENPSIRLVYSYELGTFSAFVNRYLRLYGEDLAGRVKLQIKMISYPFISTVHSERADELEDALSPKTYIAKDYKYGQGNKESSDLGLSTDGYVPMYTTDGKVIESKVTNPFEGSNELGAVIDSSYNYGIVSKVNNFSPSITDIKPSETFFSNKVVGPLLNTHPVKSNQGLAFSVFKLRDDYTGPCWTVRNAALDTADIPFDANGVIDTDSLLSFASGGSAWLVRWYAQDVNGVNAYQDSTLVQPQVVSSGSLYYVDDANTIPAADFNGDYMVNESTFSMTGSSFSSIHVSDLQSTNEMYIFSIGLPTTAGGSRIGYLLSANRWSYLLKGVLSADDTYAGGEYTYTQNTPYIHFGFSRADSIGMYINNVVSPNVTYNNPNPVGAWQTSFTLGAYENSASPGTFIRMYNGLVSEFVAWTEDKSSFRNSIYENVNIRYNVTTLQDSNAIYSVNDTTIILPTIDASITNRKVNFLLTGDDQNVTFTSSSGFLFNGNELDSLTFRNSIRNSVEFVPVFYLGSYRWMLTKKNQIDYSQLQYAGKLKADSIIQIVNENLAVGTIVETQKGTFLIESSAVSGFTADSILSLNMANGTYANYQPDLGVIPYSHIHKGGLYFQDVVIKAANYLDAYLGGGIVLVDQDCIATDEISDYNYRNVEIHGLGASDESPAIYVDLNDSSKDVINTPSGPSLYYLRMYNLNFVTRSAYNYVINIPSGAECALNSIRIESEDSSTRWGNGIYFQSYDGFASDIFIRDCKRSIEGAGPNTIKFQDIHIIDCNKGPIVAHSHWDRVTIEVVDSSAFIFRGARLSINELYLEKTPAAGVGVPVIDLQNGLNVSITNVYGGGIAGGVAVDSIAWFQVDSVAEVNITDARIQNMDYTLSTTVNTGFVHIENILEGVPNPLATLLPAGESGLVYNTRKLTVINPFPGSLPGGASVVNPDSLSYVWLGGTLEAGNIKNVDSLKWVYVNPAPGDTVQLSYNTFILPSGSGTIYLDDANITSDAQVKVSSNGTITLSKVGSGGNEFQEYESTITNPTVTGMGITKTYVYLYNSGIYWLTDYQNVSPITGITNTTTHTVKLNDFISIDSDQVASETTVPLDATNLPVGAEFTVNIRDAQTYNCVISADGNSLDFNGRQVDGDTLRFVGSSSYTLDCIHFGSGNIGCYNKTDYTTNTGYSYRSKAGISRASPDTQSAGDTLTLDAGNWDLLSGEYPLSIDSFWLDSTLYIDENNALYNVRFNGDFRIGTNGYITFIMQAPGFEDEDAIIERSITFPKGTGVWTPHNVSTTIFGGSIVGTPIRIRIVGTQDFDISKLNIEIEKTKAAHGIRTSYAP